MGPRDDTGTGATEIKPQSAHSLPPHTCSNAENTGSPRPADALSQALSRRRGWHPDLRSPPGALKQTPRGMNNVPPEPQCPEQKEDWWRTLLHTPEINREKTMPINRIPGLCAMHVCYTRASVLQHTQGREHPCASWDILVHYWSVNEEERRQEWMNEYPTG